MKLVSLLWYQELSFAEICLASCVGDVTLRGLRQDERQPFCGWGCGGFVALLEFLGMVLWCYR